MRTVLIASTLIALAGPATAATYDFRVALTSGPLAGKSLHGTFAVADAIVSGTHDYANTAGLGIAALTFTLGGTAYTRANADATFLSFDAGQLIDFSLGAAPSGFDQVAASDAAPDFLVDSISATYKLAGTDAFLSGGDTTAFQLDVPEPAALALLGVGALGLASRRRPR